MHKLSVSIPTVRNDYFDNIKAILIFLVVFGHMIEPLIKLESNSFIRSIYIFIYLFHMPCFVFVSGFFSKKGITLIDAFARFLAPLIVFHLLYTALDISLNLSSFKLQKFLLVPFHALWYLASLCFWNLILNFIPDKGIKPAIAASIIVALLIGCFSKIGLPLSLSRTFYFLPFFLLGFYFSQNGLSGVLKAASGQRLLFALFMLAIVTAFIIYPHVLPEKMLYGNTAYSGMRMGKTKGLLMRSGVLLSSLTIGFAFFKLVPSKPTFYSHFGARTLQIFLLHDIIARLLLYFRPWHFSNNQAVLLLCALLVTIVTYRLTSLEVFGKWLDQISTGTKALLIKLTQRKEQMQPKWEAYQ